MYSRDWGFDSFWNSFQDLQRVLDDVGRTAGDVRKGTPFLARAAPGMNVWANDSAVVVTSEVPGVDPSSIGITVMGDTLTVTGKRRFTVDGQEDGHAAEFNRSIQLPYRVDADRTEARCSNGLLSIAMHRPEQEKPRKIAITAA